MSDPTAVADADAVADALPAAVEAPSGPTPGWVVDKSGRYHEVEDVDGTIAAYPDQYAKCSHKDVVKARIGWPDEG